jgi:hypothetical protein
MSRFAFALIAAALLLMLAGPTSASPVSEDERVEQAFERWAPILIADQKRLFAVTRTYLKNPNDPGNVRAARKRLQGDAGRAAEFFRSLRPSGSAATFARRNMVLGASSLVRGAQSWERFVTAHSSYVKAGLDDAAAWRRLLNDHGTAERQFQEGWQDLGKANGLLGNPLARARTRPPAAPDPTLPAPPTDPIADRWYGGVGQGAQGVLVCGGVVEVTVIAPGRFSGRITHASPGVCANAPLDADWLITKTAAGAYEGTVRWYTNQGVLGVGRARWENSTTKYMSVIVSPPPNAPARTPELRMLWERLDPGDVPPYHVPR